MLPPLPTSTGLTITNPLVLYRALLATKRIDPDPAQHRLALELQKLYYRLKDYSPEAEYGARIKAIARTARPSPKDVGERLVAVPGHPLRRNPLFSHLFAKKTERDTLALTRVLTSNEAAMNLDSPKGLLLHGEVGTGKSMFLDLLADSLPNRKKRRWHFNTFMLETFAKLEHLRQSRSASGPTAGDFEHSLIWLAKDLVETSPIIFLDEFQLPDRAASKILSNLFTSFFQLGGVLVASSNRIPDELAKASGIDYAAPRRGGLVRNLLGLGPLKKMDMFPSNNEYYMFAEVLKARCEVYDLSGRDWRRREAEEIDVEAAEISEAMREEMIEGFAGLEKMAPGSEQSVLDRIAETSIFNNRSGSSEDDTKIGSSITPKKYLLTSSDNDAWEEAVRATLPSDAQSPIPWESSTLLVYGRKVPVPRHLGGVAYWKFQDLCGGSFGPADYITLASTFHTLILDEVPILTILQKNEARRLITLLDALYEARCKLTICAEAGPDDLFFPEIKDTSGPWIRRDESDGGDAVYPETLSEIYQDQTSPFRPNVTTYTDELRGGSGYDPDEDSDFGPIPGKGNEIGRQVDFGMTGSFTGEDEKFAYKRARSRLWQMCGATWNARSEAGWWAPLPLEFRRWERSSSSTITRPGALSSMGGDVKLGESIELDKPAGLRGKELENEEVMKSQILGITTTDKN